MGQEALLQWVTSASSSTRKDRAGPPFQDELTADQWGAVPPIPRAAGSRSIADFSGNPEQGAPVLAHGSVLPRLLCALWLVPVTNRRTVRGRESGPGHRGP